MMGSGIRSLSIIGFLLTKLIKIAEKISRMETNETEKNILNSCTCLATYLPIICWVYDQAIKAVSISIKKYKVVSVS
jgi:hypothetical protein